MRSLNSMNLINPPENKLWFPMNISKIRGIAINNHPGAYGAVRRHDIHTGIDLYGFENDWVFCIENGIVVKNAQFTGTPDCDWWNPTDCVVVRSETRYILYGEIKSKLQVGDVVEFGQKIGEISPVLPVDKIRKDIPGHSNCMLHLECMNLTYNNEEYPIWTKFDDRPPYLMDPTPILIGILQKKHEKFNFLTL